MAAQSLLRTWHALRTRWAEKDHRSSSSSVSLPRKGYGRRWSQAEAALVTAQLGKPCYLQDGGNTGGSNLKSALLNCDFANDRLILDACWPNRAFLESLLGRQLYWRLALRDLAMKLELECEAVLTLPDGPALQMRVVERTVQNLAVEGVVFARDHAPDAELWVPGQGLWRASLRQFSPSGLSLCGSATQPMTAWRGQAGDCTLLLSPQFRINLTVQIGAVIRQPLRQCQMQMAWSDATDEQYQQIEVFLGLLVGKAPG